MLTVQVKSDVATDEIVADYRIEWSDSSCRWNSYPTASPLGTTSFWIAILRGRPLKFELVAPASQIDNISLTCSVFEGSRSGIYCELLDTDGQIIARKQVDGDAVRSANGTPPIIDGAGLSFEPGKKYIARLSSVDGIEGDCINVRVLSAPQGRQNLHRECVGFSNRRTFVYETPDISARPGLALKIVALCDPAGSIGMALAALRRRMPGQSITLIDQNDYIRQWPLLAQADCVVFVDVFAQLGRPPAGFDALCFELHRHGTLTLFFDSSAIPDPAADQLLSLAGRLATDQNARRMHRRRCHFVLIDGAVPLLTRSLNEANWPIAGDEYIDDDLFRRMLRDVDARRMPRVAIVSVLYNKADVIETFLDQVMRQNYPGEIVVTLVNDRSPAPDAFLVQDYADIIAQKGVANRRVVVIDNATNSGNCASRNTGIAACEADIYIVIDCDCLINREFVAAHVFEHWFDDVDVVIGPMNIETNDRDGARLVRQLEHDPARIRVEGEPQDPVQADGFLNCITRNFSVKRGTLAEPLFDLDFSYSAKPGSGFGWEDVEMGYRLYARGRVIRFTNLAFAVHCSHTSSMSDQQKVIGSMRNFARLFEKHPELTQVARRWATETYGRLADWADFEKVPESLDRKKLDADFADSRVRLEPLLAGYRRGHRPLRILTYRWHVPHQYELYKLPYDFTLATDIGNAMVDVWQFDQRPMRPNVRMAPSSTIDPRQYDLAILHFDENVLAPQLTNGVISSAWGEPFRWLLGMADLPKVAICHGTAPFIGQFNADPNRKAEFHIHQDERVRLVETLAAAGAKVICNSHQAAREWMFKNSEVVWHGFDPQEFPSGTLTRDILALKPDFHRPHYRGAWEHLLVEQMLDPSIKIQTASHPGAALEMRDTNAFATRHFRSYIDRIRSFACYLNTTLRSPMPRSRGEAMMTGVIPVCLRNHDVDLFIENEKDGFYADTPEELADFLNHLFRDRGRAAPMAAAARRKAIDVFNHDRYLASWTKITKDAVG